MRVTDKVTTFIKYENKIKTLGLEFYLFCFCQFISLVRFEFNNNTNSFIYTHFA
jgi:hypothetical protein